MPFLHQVKLMTANAEVAVPIWELILTRMGITWFFCYLTLRAKKGEWRTPPGLHPSC